MLIGLCGRKRSGKDTTALVLGHADRGGFRRVAFADALKDLVSKSFDLSLDAFGDMTKELLCGRLDLDGKMTLSRRPEHVGFTPRWLLQRIGVGAREALGQDFWIRRVLDGVEAGTYGLNVVITDVHFCNEAQAVMAAGGKLVRLNRNDDVEPHAWVWRDGCTTTRCWHETIDSDGTPRYPCPAEWYAHPCSVGPDPHPSENDLPCEPNALIEYDLVVRTGGAQETAKQVAAWIKTQLGGSPNNPT